MDIQVPMKNSLIIPFLILKIFIANGQKNTGTKAVVNSTTITTKVYQDDNDEITINVNHNDLEKFKQNGIIRYSDLGAIGDGVSDDMIFIVATHILANQYGFNVKADDGAKYLIGGRELTAIIETNTDFGSATFIIDDTYVENRFASVFEVKSKLKPISINTVKSMIKNQIKVDLRLKNDCLILVSDNNTRRYIRYGLNQNKGRAQTDIFILHKNGNIESTAPVIWDFENITEMIALPIDKTNLFIKGGRFITIANKAPSKYTYYSRNISIKRSNVEVSNLEHLIEGEGSQGAPYNGFISISDCYNVLVKVTRSIGLTFVNCRQTNDINDNRYWGIFASNYSKNISFENCILSRFDAHMGVYNATISNSTLGYMGINAIGSGEFLIENSTIKGRSLINLRPDYGSTWDGTFKIRNCIFVPTKRKSNMISLFSGSNSGLHDFGYTCYMPKNITIEKLYIDDMNQNDNYKTIAIFSNFNPKMIDESFNEKFKYIKTEKLILKDISISSKKKLILSENPFMFRYLKIETD